jgi:selenophosphate synthetase-related protein
MLLESSGVGATVELGKIPRNESVGWEQWLKLYPGSGFVLTAESSKVNRCIELLEEVNITASVVGEIIEDKKFYVTHEDQKAVLFDFQKDKITGVKEERS